MDQELERLLVETRHRDFIRKLYAKRTDYIVDLVKAKVFLRNDSLESYAHDVVNRLTEANPTLTRPLVLVARTPEVNALCYARGIYIVTVGLLARISTEGELAFTLAHELAHGELDHVKVDKAESLSGYFFLRSRP